MQIVSVGDNLHVMSKPVTREKNKKEYFNLSSAEYFTQSANNLSIKVFLFFFSSLYLWPYTDISTSIKL